MLGDCTSDVSDYPGTAPLTRRPLKQLGDLAVQFADLSAMSSLRFD